MESNSPLVNLRLELGKARCIKAKILASTNSVECTADALTRYDIELLQRIANKHVAVMSMTAKDSKIIVSFSIEHHERT